MRRTNWRLVIAGGLLIVLALTFLIFMQFAASKSTDPAALMGTVGTVSGVAGGIGIAMISLGLIGSKS